MLVRRGITDTLIMVIMKKLDQIAPMLTAVTQIPKERFVGPMKDVRSILVRLELFGLDAEHEFPYWVFFVRL
jgi:hypothetical protein